MHTAVTRAAVALTLLAAGVACAAAAAPSDLPAPGLGDPPGPRQLSHFERLAEGGNACAKAAAGYLRAQGIGAPAEPDAGRAAVTQAAADGCARAHYLLARLDEARPPADRRAQVRAALEAGAAAGDGHAVNHLGIGYEIDGDAARAQVLYRDAQARGNRAAAQNLLRLRRLAELGPEREPLQALERRAHAGDAQAQYRLARRIHRGEGALIDLVAAWHWYRESARRGFEPAHEMMALVLAQPDARNEDDISARWWAKLARVDVPSDPLLRQRGLRQPIVDEDPFYGMDRGGQRR